jgi:hypothetical protein
MSKQDSHIRNISKVALLNQKKNVADPDSGSGRIRIRDEQSGSYFQELKPHFFGLKYLNSLMRNRDPGWKKFDFGLRVGKNSNPG